MSELNFVTVGDGTRIAYCFDGDARKPVLVLSNSIATTLHMWDGQIAELSKHFRVLRYDFAAMADRVLQPAPIRSTGLAAT